MTESLSRTCLVTPEYPPRFWGGLAQSVRRIARFISEAGWEVHIANCLIEGDGPGLLDEIVHSVTEDGMMVHRIQIGREGDLPRDSLWASPDSLSMRLMYHALERLHHRYHFGVFHAFFIYPLGYVAALLARVYSKKLILSIRGNDINQYIFSPEKAMFLWMALKQADTVTSVSRDLLLKADSLTPVTEKSRVIFNSIAPRTGGTSPIVLPALRGSVIGAFGLFKYSKGLPYLLKAFRDMRGGRHASLLLVGDIREAEEEIHHRYLARFGSQDVHMTGPIPHESMDSYLRQVDVVVIPSLSEGCPNILLEAMAAARPIVATRTGAIPEVIQDGESGILVDPGEASQIKAAMLYFLDHPEQADAMGRKARARVEALSEAREKAAWREVYTIISESPRTQRSPNRMSVDTKS